MNPETGAIAKFETKEDAELAGYTVQLTKKETRMLANMNRHERRKWAAEQRRKKAK